MRPQDADRVLVGWRPRRRTLLMRHLAGARIASRGSQRQGKFSAWAARTEAVLVKALASRPSEPPSVGKHSGKAHGNIKQQRSLDSCSVSLVRGSLSLWPCTVFRSLTVGGHVHSDAFHGLIE